jgi:hypothetical protein
MRNYLKALVITSLVVGIIGCENTKKKNQVEENELVNYLESNWMEPDDYVIKKFTNYDYVFIGEYHRIKHDVDLILELIPKLYENGIYNLGIEFGDYKDQNLVDSLLILPEFDRKLAQDIMFRCSPDWGYQEYIDIYEFAWKVNHSEISKNKKKFRVINLAANYNPCKEGGAWKDINPDVFMADVIFSEIISKDEKALIYSGNHHAFTKYHQPYYDFNRDTLISFTTNRMGNIIYDSLPNKTFNIYLHAAWTSNIGWDEPSILPVNGIIDSTMAQFEHRPVGFDVVNSPFGKLKSTDSYYALGYSNFTLDQYCDGYIYQNEFKNYQTVTMEENFITEDNISELKAYFSCLNVPEEVIDSITVNNINNMMKEDIKEHFGHLMK